MTLRQVCEQAYLEGLTTVLEAVLSVEFYPSKYGINDDNFIQEFTQLFSEINDDVLKKDIKELYGDL